MTRKWSSSHLNPAVSLYFWLSNHYDWKKLIGLVISQCLGAILASLLVSLFASENSLLGATLPKSGLVNTSLLEVFMTFLLLLLISFANKLKSMAALFIALLVGIEAYFGGPFTGASMNPARSLGPALIANSWDLAWIYFVAPSFGALLVWVIRKLN